MNAPAAGLFADHRKDARFVRAGHEEGSGAKHPLPDAPGFAILRAMITIQETLVVDAQGHAIITLPPSVKPGTHRAVLHIEDEDASAPEKKRVVPKAGSLKGIWMAPDFDAPLEDFREYME